jgi:hypothetical protein
MIPYNNKQNPSNKKKEDEGLNKFFLPSYIVDDIDAQNDPDINSSASRIYQFNANCDNNVEVYIIIFTQ